MTLLLIQMSTILLTTLLCGWVALKLGQARVIGEIIGGILVGPSALGRIAPHLSARLFPTGSLGPLEVLSTIGLMLFLFLIGSELNYEHLGQQKKTTILAICTSILFPFLVAAAVAHSLHIRFTTGGIGLLPFYLFLGIGLSVETRALNRSTNSWLHSSLSCWRPPLRRRPWAYIHCSAHLLAAYASLVLRIGRVRCGRDWSRLSPCC